MRPAEARFEGLVAGRAAFRQRRAVRPIAPAIGDQVFVEVRPWVFEARPVEVAFPEGDQAIVTGGLKAGERIKRVSG